MAMLASKNTYAPSTGAHTQPQPRTFSEASHRTQLASAGTLQDRLFTSPTDSEFSDAQDVRDSIRAWDEKKVGEWLHTIRCGQYEPLFRSNHVTGETLMECDQKILSEMGIKKIGDRVRINVAIKQLRNKTNLRSRIQRDSLAALEAAFTPSSSDSPRNASRPQLSGNRRYSRQIDPSIHLTYGSAGVGMKPASRPSSPFGDSHSQSLRAQRYMASPMDNGRRETSGGYFSQPSSANSTNGRRPETPGQATRVPAHLRQNSSIDALTPGGLPINSPVIKVIYTGGQTKVINVKFCRTADDVTSTVLKKLSLPETQFRNYCFYVLNGLDPDTANCRRISDAELMRICNEATRSERNRLILRKINDGTPDFDEVQKAAQIAIEESQVLHNNAISTNNMRNQIKLQKLTGESWQQIKQPRSPVTTTDRHRNMIATADEQERQEALKYRNLHNAQNTKIRSFFGARPPSEMITQDLTAYFPGHEREEIEKTVKLSARRSQRMSRAASRLSVVSNGSVASSLREAPPVPAIPNIADAWLAQTGQGGRGLPRPLSVSRFGLPSSAFRDSIASTTLQPLQEESPLEPNRKSYVSFDSSSESAHLDTARASYIEDSPSGTLGVDSNTLNQRLSIIVAEDGEEEDIALNSFLAGHSFDKSNWMKGDLIGEGSFGSVYLALHAVTGELMAVKQVELPNVAKGTESDKKKQNMITALKQEIDLLQGLRHQHIVQYLGTSSDENHLNIFLEYVPGGSIAGMLKQYNTFQEPLIRNFVRQILDGLSYLHGRNIIHRDIKGANVLVDNKGSIKISDFGISKRSGDVHNPTEGPSSSSNGPSSASIGLNRPSLQGSVFWMAPEVVRQSAHTKKADIWSLGCLIVEMFSGSRPFPDKSQLQALFAIGNNQAKPHIPEVASAEAKRFLEKTFEIDFERRPSAEELSREKFLGPMA